MQRWEYKWVTQSVAGLISSKVDEQGLDEMNALGSEGWELVGIIHLTEREGVLYRYTLVFKRPYARVDEL